MIFLMSQVNKARLFTASLETFILETDELTLLSPDKLKYRASSSGVKFIPEIY